jgi:hypothetical protein
MRALASTVVFSGLAAELGFVEVPVPVADVFDLSGGRHVCASGGAEIGDLEAFGKLLCLVCNLLMI